MCSKSPVPVLENVRTRADFEDLAYPKRSPVVLRGLDVGRAPSLWTPQYLCSQCGSKQVMVHVCAKDEMEFLDKNFMYKQLPFGELVKRASSDHQEEFFFSKDEKYYLRALGNDIRKDIACFETSFPELADDIKLPYFFEDDKKFSSVLRVGSANIQLWTHYDIMDNLLVQVRGLKRIVLFPPSDASYLYLSGDKSEIVNIEQPDFARFPLFQKAHAMEAILEPGDAIFIPALWFHNVRALEFSVAVNIFWRHLQPEAYDKKDPYGNKDVLPAQRAFQMVDKAVLALKDLPVEYQQFYGQRMIKTIEKKLHMPT